MYVIKFGRTKLLDSLLNFSFSFWTIYLTIRFLFWNIGFYIFGFPLFFIIPFLITITYLILLAYYHQKLRLPQIALTFYFLFSIILSCTHSDKIFYFIRLNTLINSESRKSDYYSWDKYSWFLFKVGKTNEALDANRTATKALEYNLEKTGYYDNQFLEMINDHKEKIQKKNWTTYP